LSEFWQQKFVLIAAKYRLFNRANLNLGDFFAQIA
jgi:hypothetical protein